MKIVPATWVLISNERESHAVNGVVFGRLWFAYCGKQWSDSVVTEASADKHARCDTCQGRAIEAARIAIGLDEVAGHVLWEAEMFE